MNITLDEMTSCFSDFLHLIN